MNTLLHLLSLLLLAATLSAADLSPSQIRAGRVLAEKAAEATAMERAATVISAKYARRNSPSCPLAGLAMDEAGRLRKEATGAWRDAADLVAAGAVTAALPTSTRAAEDLARRNADRMAAKVRELEKLDAEPLAARRGQRTVRAWAEAEVEAARKASRP